MHTDYTGQGVDQLAEVIKKIKTDPYDRRIILSAWNPSGTHLNRRAYDLPYKNSSCRRFEYYGVAPMSYVLSVFCG